MLYGRKRNFELIPNDVFITACQLDLTTLVGFIQGKEGPLGSKACF